MIRLRKFNETNLNSGTFKHIYKALNFLIKIEEHSRTFKDIQGHPRTFKNIQGHVPLFPTNPGSSSFPLFM